jgi:glutamyl-tRNA synthetase
MSVKVRMAPSPTGHLHIGTARVALFNYLYAKKTGGKFVLRIEDTDVGRSDRRYEMNILSGLKWLGLRWDEGPYRQSDRIDFYTKYVDQLLNEGKAFWCYHTTEELEREREEQMKNKEIPRHVCSYKDSEEKREKGIIRLKVDENSKRKIAFEDMIREKVEIEERLLGDVSIAKDEKTPLYNFAVVCDDYDMGITHVIRGEDHISNTPKQILIQEALGFPRPQYAHLPLILGPDKSKMSKRHGSVSLSEFKDQGYLPGALVNYMAMLGLTLPEEKEIMSMGEIIEIFNLGEVHKSGAIFDIKKLDWVNGQYINKIDDGDLRKLMKKYLEGEYNSAVGKSAKMIKERLTKLSDLEEFDFLYREPRVDRELLIWKKGTAESAREALDRVEEIIVGHDPSVIRKIWSKFWGGNPYEGLRDELDRLANNKFEKDRGAVYWPFRVALSGRKHSPDPIDILQSIGKEKALQRVRRAMETL